MFGGRGKKHEVKQHVLNFSGFTWEDEEKESEKVQTKLGKQNVSELKEVAKTLDLHVGGTKVFCYYYYYYYYYFIFIYIF